MVRQAETTNNKLRKDKTWNSDDGFIQHQSVYIDDAKNHDDYIVLNDTNNGHLFYSYDFLDKPFIGDMRNLENLIIDVRNGLVSQNSKSTLSLIEYSMWINIYNRNLTTRTWS